MESRDSKHLRCSEPERVLNIYLIIVTMVTLALATLVSFSML